MDNKMPEKWYGKLVELCSVESHSRNEKRMVLYLDAVLEQLGLPYTIDNVGNIIVTKGEGKTYPCIVAHMDTVHSFVDNYTVYVDKTKRTLFAQDGKVPTGIGGDDKCGVFACLYFLTTLPVVKAVFFTQEESGCQGSNHIDKSFFDDCRYIIQLDRRGSTDFIDTKEGQKTVSHKFASEIGNLKRDYKFKSTSGTITDSMNLWSDGVGVSCVNISSGYYSPHSNSEYILFDELWHSVMFTKQLIKTLKPMRYECIKQKAKIIQYSNWNSKSYKVNNIYDTYCGSCKQKKAVSLGVYLKNKFMCYTCIRESGKYTMCDICYKYTDDNDLAFDTIIRKLVCPACLALEGTVKRTKKLGDAYYCDVCTTLSTIEEGHVVKDSDTGFVCNQCYEDFNYALPDKSLVELEVCSICDQEKSKDMGIYNGELFICSVCKGTTGWQP